MLGSLAAVSKTMRSFLTEYQVAIRITAKMSTFNIVVWPLAPGLPIIN